VVEEEDWGNTVGRVSAPNYYELWRDNDTLLRQIGEQGIMLTQLCPLLLFPARLFQGALGWRGGDHSWISGHWGDKPKCPKNRGKGLESLVMKGRAGVRNATRFATV
jgi:hypothetical protein